jgi:pimeloyl-ACP methyl ester carboxylesterase
MTPKLASDHAPRIRCLSLVIHGDQDAITPLARGGELARLAGSELIAMAGSGREPQYGTPGLVNAHLEAFLGAVLKRPG